MTFSSPKTQSVPNVLSKIEIDVHFEILLNTLAVKQVTHGRQGTGLKVYRRPDIGETDRLDQTVGKRTSRQAGTCPARNKEHTMQFAS